MYVYNLTVCALQQTFLGATELDDELIKQLPKEVLLRVFSYLDVVSLCRCAQVGVTPPPHFTPTLPPSPVACNNCSLSIKINESFRCRCANIGTCLHWTVPAGRKSIYSISNVISRCVSQLTYYTYYCYYC